MIIITITIILSSSNVHTEPGTVLGSVGAKLGSGVGIPGLQESIAQVVHCPTLGVSLAMSCGAQQ